MTTWRAYTAERRQKHAHQAASCEHLAAWRQRLVVQEWRSCTAVGARLKRTCALLLRKWGGHTQAAVLLSWRATAQAGAKERCVHSAGLVSLRPCTQAPTHF